MSPEGGLNKIDVVMDLETIGLGEWMNTFSESQAISQPTKMDLTSCSYNSASHRLVALI